MAAVLVKERLIGWWHCLTLMCCTCVLLSSLPRCFQFILCQIFFFCLQCQTFSIHLQKKRTNNKKKKKSPKICRAWIQCFACHILLGVGVQLVPLHCFCLKTPHLLPMCSDLRTNSGEHFSSIHYISIHPSIHPPTHPSIFQLLTGELNDYWCSFLLFKKMILKTSQTEKFPSMSSQTLVVFLAELS